MRKRYHKTGTIILAIFAVAVICVLAIIFYIFNSGLRYMRTELTGIRYFGRVSPGGYITDGRIWFENTAASIRLQRFYIIEINDARAAGALDIRDFAPADDVLFMLNESIPEDMREGFPLGHFMFNPEGAPVVFRTERFPAVIRGHQRAAPRNNIISGEILAADGILWTLLSSKANPDSYRDFEIVPNGDRLQAYRGDLLSFVADTDIKFASFTLAAGNIINLYPAHNIYRIEYERGVNSGDLYIGGITANIEKNGRGIYFYETGNIYFGDFVRNEKTGFCMILFTNGDSYSGGVLDGRKEGFGVFAWADGSRYSGYFRNNLKNGRGVYLFANGEVYDGDWVDGVKHGFGRFEFATGDVYEGEFEYDMFSGEGRYVWASGEYFEGSFRHNSIYGWGRYTWTTGRTYEGWFYFGEMVLEPPPSLRGD